MMRIVIASSITIRGGAWRYIKDQAVGLRERGCDVTMALPAGASQLRSEAAKLGLRVQGTTPHTQTDIWHFHLADTYDPQVIRALPLARLVSRSVLITEHLPRSDASDPSVRADGQVQSFGAWPAKTALKRAQYAMCERVICPSESSRQFVLLRYGIDQRKVTTVPCGIPMSSLPPDPWPSGSPLFVGIGAIIVQKGFDVLIEAAALAREPWQAVIIGDGPHLTALQARASALRVPVRFTGWSNDVTPALASASALVAPSRWESSSYVAMEAMAQGRPVVATRVDGLSDIVVDGSTGLLVRPNDPKALAAALDRLASDPSFAQMLGRTSRERVKLFSFDAMVEALLSVYSDSLSRGLRTTTDRTRL
ncbi:MAG TPA: glycosyltransferase family 4 protein [Acidimicrobiales bacterium]|jgi:glycosyltransferase involved in cell wall biosynthesis|nr:glycosyltransferase family 4 protein [Acidimicrobiales bacterium]